MKLLLSSMLLASLCALSSWSVSSGVTVVTQTPDVSVTEGETVNITCCWTVKVERIRIEWLKNQTEIRGKTKLWNYRNNSQASLQKKNSGCSYLAFMNITREDSGRYTCRLTVEIPLLFIHEGNGTIITVTARDNGNKEYNGSGGVSPGVPVVTQTPDVSVTEGETVNITCCWTVKFDRMTVNWLKNQTEIRGKTKLWNYRNNSQASLQKKNSGCSYLAFMNIKGEDSGRYTCRLTVEIPEFCIHEGNGTIITVTARDNSNKDYNGSGDVDLPITRGPVVLVYLVRCLPIIALISTFFCLHKLGTKARQRALAAPGNKAPAAQRTEEEDQEEDEEEGVEGETEAE